MLKIILVDDNPNDRALVRRQLNRSFPAVHIQDIINADQLESALKKGDFDVAITDFILGWTNGLEILKLLKAHCPGCPVLMFTATAKQEDAIAAMKAGLDDYVVKSPQHLARLPVALQAVLEQKRQRELLRESERLAVVGRLTATIVHEISNPLDSLQSILYLIQTSQEASFGIRDFAAQGMIEAHRIKDIINRTLGLSRQATVPVSVSLANIVDDVVALYTRRMEADNIVLERRYEYTEHIDAYPNELRQLVSNLLANALDAVQQNGKVTIHIFKSRDWKHPSRYGVRLYVGDSGPGIAPEHLNRIFDAFFTTKGEKGSGLGLWISQGIVAKHGGAIRLRSSNRLGQSGTCFSVFLPEQVSAQAVSAPH